MTEHQDKAARGIQTLIIQVLFWGFLVIVYLAWIMIVVGVMIAAPGYFIGTVIYIFVSPFIDRHSKRKFQSIMQTRGEQLPSFYIAICQACIASVAIIYILIFSISGIWAEVIRALLYSPYYAITGQTP